MPQPPEQAVEEVERFCAERVPAEFAEDRVRIEARRRGNTINILECRPPWHEDLGSDWTSSRVCSLVFDPRSNTWSLFARDRNDRRLDYPGIGPCSSVRPLLAEVEADPTGIFWG